MQTPLTTALLFLSVQKEFIKAQAYTSLVRPTGILEYGSSAWDPYRMYQKNWLEQVQRGAAHFTTSTYSRQEGCVTQHSGQMSAHVRTQRSNECACAWFKHFRSLYGTHYGTNCA